MAKRAGVQLREWLRAERRSQDWLAEKIGTHQTNVSAWIRGRPIPLDMALAVQRVTKIDPKDWLVEIEGGPTGAVDSTGTEG